jgi:hypothetical protein
VEARTQTRTIEIATALLLGIISVVTALGVLQASSWQDAAGRLGLDSSDARDQAIALGVATTIELREDARAVLEARRIALLQDDAIAAGDVVAALTYENDLRAQLGNVSELDQTEFDAWRDGGFDDGANPTIAGSYFVSLVGPGAALTIVSSELGELSGVYKSKAAVFGQAALVHALALFLFGVAGINRLRTARIVTLGLGAAVFLFGLFLMSTAY